MSEASLHRSPQLLNRFDTALLVVDLQQRLLAAQPDREAIVWNAGRLVRAAQAVGATVTATEQAPQKLGPTAPRLAELALAPIAKQRFSASCGSLLTDWRARPVRHVVIAGVETHVCVAQTALDLIAEGFEVQVAVDAVGSRFAIDHSTALRRLESLGVTLTTTEAVMFEWCESADDDAFKAISALAKESRPAQD